MRIAGYVYRCLMLNLTFLLISAASHGQANFGGTYTGTAQSGGYTHTETDVVAGNSINALQTFTNGIVSGSFAWQGIITSGPTNPNTGTITGQGTINNAGTRAFTLSSGSIILNSDGSADLIWSAVDPVFGPIGGSAHRNPLSSAHTTYSYVGNAYNQFGGTFACPPVCGIKGSFTVATPLAPNANYYFTPLSFSFTDGLTTFTPSNVTASGFGVVTDSLSQITGWNMGWQVPGDDVFSSTNPPGCVGCRVVDGSFTSQSPTPLGFAEINNTPGTWTQSTSTGPFAYVPIFGAGAVSVFDVSSNLSVATVPLAGGPFAAAVSPDGSHVYISRWQSGMVSEINTVNNTVSATISVGANPGGVAFTPDGTTVYVTGSVVDAIDVATNTVKATIPVGVDTSFLAITPDGKYVYASGSNTVFVISVATNSVIANVPVGGAPGVPAVSPNGKDVYVPCGSADLVYEIDTSSNTVVRTIFVAGSPYGMSISPDGGTGYVAEYYGAATAVVNLASNTVVTTIPNGTIPIGSAVTPDGAFVWQANLNSNYVAIISTATNSVVTRIPVNGGVYDLAIGPAPPTSQTITLPLSPTAPNQFNFGPHNFTVQYPPGTSFPSVNMTVTATQTSQATFSQRVAGTTFSNANCIVYSGTSGTCVDYQVSCSTLSGSAISCPSIPTPSITVKTSFDTQQLIINPGFLTAPIGTNQWENIFTAFFLQRVDPTVKGHTSGFSEFFAVDLGATNAQGEGTLQILPPLSKTSTFSLGQTIPAKFQLMSIAQPTVPVADAIAGISVEMLTDLAGNPAPQIMLEEPSAFVYRGGMYHCNIPTTGYPPGIYNMTIYGNAFVSQEVQFTITASTE
jgi:YVTN family beta-propeller protein